MGWLKGFTFSTCSLHTLFIFLLLLPWSHSYGEETTCVFELEDNSTKRSYEDAITAYIESECYLTDPNEGESLRTEIGNVNLWQDGKLNYARAKSVYRLRQESLQDIGSVLEVAERENRISQEGAQQLQALISQLARRSEITPV